MKNNRVYKHTRCQDTAIHVITTYQGKTHLKVKCVWLNIVNPDNHYIIGPDQITIKNEDISNWQELL